MADRVTQRFVVHPDNPQPRIVRQLAEVLRRGGVIALPTDACYVLACAISDKDAVTRMRAIRRLDERHLLTLMCADLRQLASYAQVDNRQYRFLREWTPGPYTFVLPATKEIPRRLWHPSRRTIGLRVPRSALVHDVLEVLGEPALTCSLILPDDDAPLHDADEVLERLARRVDAVVDAGGQGYEPTTVIEMTGDEPVVVRVGCGPVDAMLRAE